jgi:hypothetical protein
MLLLFGTSTILYFVAGDLKDYSDIKRKELGNIFHPIAYLLRLLSINLAGESKMAKMAAKLKKDRKAITV